MRCGAVRCGAVRCGAVRCGAVRCGAVRCGAVRCGAVRCGAVRCGAVRPNCCLMPADMRIRLSSISLSLSQLILSRAALLALSDKASSMKCRNKSSVRTWSMKRHTLTPIERGRAYCSSRNTCWRWHWQGYGGTGTCDMYLDLYWYWHESSSPNAQQHCLAACLAAWLPACLFDRHVCMAAQLPCRPRLPGSPVDQLPCRPAAPLPVYPSGRPRMQKLTKGVAAKTLRGVTAKGVIVKPGRSCPV